MSGSSSARSVSTSRYRRTFRFAALAVVLAGTIFWAAKGARLGWSQHQVPIAGVDEFTGLEYVHYEQRFVPGVEWLTATAGVGAALFALSFLSRFNPKS